MAWTIFWMFLLQIFCAVIAGKVAIAATILVAEALKELIRDIEQRQILNELMDRIDTEFPDN